MNNLFRSSKSSVVMHKASERGTLVTVIPDSLTWVEMEQLRFD